MKINIAFFVSLFATLTIKAQYDSDYQPLKSSSKLPDSFILKAKATSEAEIKALPYTTPNYTATKQFSITNNYFLRELFLSGRILFNDPLTIYVNKVADELLKNDKALRAELKIFVIKNSSVNAHAFDKGYIFINVGLLAQLENEAQLAYILAHEITHVSKKHSLKQYINDIKLEKSSDDYERGSEIKMLNKYSYSKDQETEADVEGLAIMKKSGYSIKTIIRAFDVLQYSYLPFELPEFKKDFFEHKHLALPDTLILKKVQDIKANEDYDDSKSSHPNIRKRRASVEIDLKVNDEANRKKYLVSEDEFKKVRENARFELCRNYLMERDYVNAIYASYILLEKYPNNVYLKRTIAQALYNLSTVKTGVKKVNRISISGSKSYKRDVIKDYKEIEGASQRLYYLLDNLENDEYNVLALSYVYNAHKKHPNDMVLSKLTDSLIGQIVEVNKLYINDFSTYSKEELKLMDSIKTKQLLAKEEQEEEEESKYTRIKTSIKKVELEKTDASFVKYAFVDFLKDEDFVKRYTVFSKAIGEKAIKKDDYIKTKEKKKLIEEDKLLGIDKVILLDPYYKIVKTENGKEQIDYFKSEEKESGFTAQQLKISKTLNLNCVNFSADNLTYDNIDLYNATSLINEWLSERFEHGNNSKEMMSNSEEIKELISKYGTPYVIMSGLYNKNTKYNAYFFILFNLETGEALRFETRELKGSYGSDYISQVIYNSLYHTKAKQKE
jgi:Zn-dependent protease with chaperone function